MIKKISMQYKKIFLKAILVMILAITISALGKLHNAIPFFFFVLSIPIFFGEVSSFFKESSNADRGFILVAIFALFVNLIHYLFIEGYEIVDLYKYSDSSEEFGTLLLPSLIVLIGWIFFKLYKKFEK